MILACFLVIHVYEYILGFLKGLKFIFFSSIKNRSRKQSFDSTGSSDAQTDLVRTRSIDSICLRFNLEAGALLPLALKYVPVVFYKWMM